MIILKAEDISKQYRLGTVGTGTLSHDLNRFWYKVRGKEDPYLKIGAVNDRSSSAIEEYVWALRDINFEVEEGEVLGIIGKNGAGKSTLLKILSQVTAPTTGIIKSNGRIASLLEVGTGFHPELTGRENIFLNGAILGMTRAEIRSKLDEIIDFSGCELYIDTPVKRYSSGMKVRLAFAVAAHLEPDIMVVDEVLAVGDAEFQKKAIGKMQDISTGEGRTVLFVSHNMAAVESLCTRAMVLNQGYCVYEGTVSGGLEFYRKLSSDAQQTFDFATHRPEFDSVKIAGFEIVDKTNKPIHSCYMDEEIGFKFKIDSKIATSISLRITLFDRNETRVLAFDSADVASFFDLKPNQIATIYCSMDEALNLKAGEYAVNISIRQGSILYDHIKEVTVLNIVEKDVFGHGRFSFSDMPIVLKKHSWK